MTKLELLEILAELGWSQNELARRVGVHSSTVSQWKRVPGPVQAYLRLRVMVERMAAL